VIEGRLERDHRVHVVLEQEGVGVRLRRLTASSRG
jgi:hypothetical protein